MTVTTATTTTTTQGLHGKRVLVIASYDSFLKTASLYAEMLRQQGAHVDYVLALARPRQVSKSQHRAMGFDEAISIRTVDTIATRDFLAPYDICLLSLDGLRTRHFSALFSERLRGAPKRPITLSFYPGLIFRFHLEGWCSRASSDLVLLNSPADQQWYRQLLQGLGLERDNSLCAGLALLPSLQPRLKPRHLPDGDVVFMGQPTVPTGLVEREYVVDQLIQLARRYPDQSFLLKPRHRPGETTLHPTRYHYQDLLTDRSDAPKNLHLTYAPVDRVLSRTKLCLTYSSTAALEAVAFGIPTRVLTDFGIHENIGNHFFLQSGMLADLSSVHPDMEFRLEAAWFERHARAATDSADAICTRVRALLDEQEALGYALPPVHDRLFGRSPEFNAFLQASRKAPLWQFGEASGWKKQSARLGALATRAWGVATRFSPVRRSSHTPRG